MKLNLPYCIPSVQISCSTIQQKLFHIDPCKTFSCFTSKAVTRPHLSASMATLTFCSEVVCWDTAAGQPVCGVVDAGAHMPCWFGGDMGQPELKFTGGGDVAIEAIGLLLLKLSEAFSRENIVSASGKLGGVAGVLAGVHII